MDQKRILWIVAASGLFLLVVVGVALFISAPQTQTRQGLDSLQANGNTWIKGEVKNPESIDALIVQDSNNSISDNPESSDKTDINTDNQTITVDTVTLIAGTTNVYTQNEQTVSAQKDSAPEKSTTITVNTVSKEQTSPAKSTVTSNTSSTKTTSTKNTVDCVEPQVSTTTSNKTSASKSVTSTQPIADQYWVQVASFTGKKNAEDARAALLEEKINSEIFTYKDSKGVIYYRLRVGPYTTKSEAEYWHSRIKLIEQFAGTSSYVVNSTGKAQN